MRKIIWIADFKQEDRPGGAQITNRTMVEYGRKLGYEVVELSAKDIDEPFNRRIFKKAYYILNNYVVIHSKQNKYLKRVIEETDYSRYIHDYDWVYPSISGSFIDRAFSRAKSVIYLSPLHKKQNDIKQFRHPNSVVIPSPINTKLFVPDESKRVKDTVLFSGEINTHKGLHNVYNYALFNPKKTVDIYGWVAHPGLTTSLPSNVKIIGKEESEKMSEIYQRYESTIHLPNWFEPFGRSVAEAYLSGCKMIVNEKVGFNTFDWDYGNIEAVRKEISESPANFWKHIGEQL